MRRFAGQFSPPRGAKIASSARLLAEGGVGDDAVAEEVGGAAGGTAEAGVAGGVGDLVGEVEQLLHPADEVAGGQVGRAEYVVEGVALGPAVRRPREPEIRLAQEVEMVVVFECV